MKLFIFVHREVNTLSTIIKAENEDEARTILSQRLKQVMFESHINIPLERTWECIGARDVNETREIKGIS